MTAERLEVQVISTTEKVLGRLILTPLNKSRINVEGDFLSSGMYCMGLNKLKVIIRLRAKIEYNKGYEITYTPIITHHTQNEMVPE